MLPDDNHRRLGDTTGPYRAIGVDFQCCIESTISVRRNLTFAGMGRPG
jgi:hypothetical protein